MFIALLAIIALLLFAMVSKLMPDEADTIFKSLMAILFVWLVVTNWQWLFALPVAAFYLFIAAANWFAGSALAPVVGTIVLIAVAVQTARELHRSWHDETLKGMRQLLIRYTTWAVGIAITVVLVVTLIAVLAQQNSV
jgi:hypothetical protein